MFPAVLAFVAGILLFQQLPFLPSARWLWGILLLAPCWYLSRRRIWLPMLATGFAYAFLHALLTFPAEVPEAFLGETVLAQGRIDDLPRQQGDRARFLFRAQTLQLGERQLQGDWRFRLSWYREVPELHSGARWRLPVRLRKVVGYRNPGSFDYSGWLFGQGVRYSGYVKGEGELLQPAAGTLDGLRQGLSQRLGKSVESPGAAAIMRALAVGDRSGMRRQDREVFAATGTSHLIAISGLHIGLVSGLAYLLGRFLWCRVLALCARWPASVAAVPPALLAGAGYAALAGFSLPTQRALIMLAVIMGALLLRRHLHPLQAMAIALLLVVIRDPLSLQSAGFWLSFGAVGILYLVASRGKGRWSWLWQQFSISLGLMPILIWQQMDLSLLSPLVNLAAIPLFSLLVVPGVLLGLLLEVLAGWPGDWLLQGTAWLLDGFYRVLEWLARWNPQLSGRELLLWLLLAVVFVAGTWRILQGRRRSLVLAVAMPAVMLLSVRGFLSPRPAVNSFELQLLDVGQGLSAVVRTSDHLLIFDTGPRFPSGFNTGHAVLVPYLRTLGVGRVDRLLLSHGDLDHVGGATGLLQYVGVEEILGGEPARLAIHRSVERCHRGEQWWWDGVHFEILSPGLVPGAEGNDASCVLRVSTGDQALLLTGDIEAGVEQALVKVDAAGLGSSVVVAAHHGSRSSSSAGFIEAVAPRYVLFSAGVHNRWGFPRVEVEQRWCDGGAVPLNTAVEGAIGFRFTPSSLQGPFLHARRHRRYWQWQMEQQIPVACSMIAGSLNRGRFAVYELIKAGGLLMWPIIACSVAAMAITLERMWAYRRKRVVPDHLLPQIWKLYKKGELDRQRILAIRESSPLGRMLATGLSNLHHSREVMKEAIEEEGRQVVHELERYLNALGTIAAISPLLGLLGTVIGMIKVFTAITAAGVGNPGVLAGGISEALITTAAGLSVAIPSLIAHRYLTGKVDELAIAMEEQAIKMVEVLHGEREQ